MSKRQRQQTFEGERFQKSNDCFGGSLLRNSHAKTKRPIDSKLPIHIVLRSVKGNLRLPKTFARVNAGFDRTCRKHGVTVYKYANVGNHIHALIKIPQRGRWNAFIRELTGRISQFVSAALVGNIKKSDSQKECGYQINRRIESARERPTKTRTLEKFWSQRPFTRIVRGWQKAFRIAKQYVELNRLEAEGFISRAQIKNLRDLKAIFDIEFVDI